MQARINILALGTVVLLTTGCESTRWNWLKSEPPRDLANKSGPAPGSTALIQYLNDNANRVKSLKVDDLSIDVTMDSQSFGVRGRIFAEKPRNFRMKATAFGKDEADIGSNQQEFWFWIGRSPEPQQHQYFCTYKDLEDGRVRMMPLPIQPEWVMETLGLGPYGPADRYQVEDDRRSLRLIQQARSPQGLPVRKVIVMNRQEVVSPQPQVTDYLLLDEKGQEICSAHIMATMVDRESGAILPYKMELRMPMQKMKLALKLDSMVINNKTQLTPAVFVRQPVPGVQPFNLSTGQAEPWGLQRAQGIAPAR